jgi:hypothetical protein
MVRPAQSRCQNSWHESQSIGRSKPRLPNGRKHRAQGFPCMRSSVVSVFRTGKGLGRLSMTTEVAAPSGAGGAAKTASRYSAFLAAR